jgi:hypothetical protein
LCEPVFVFALVENPTNKIRPLLTD